MGYPSRYLMKSINKHSVHQNNRDSHFKTGRSDDSEIFIRIEDEEKLKQGTTLSQVSKQENLLSKLLKK